MTMVVDDPIDELREFLKAELPAGWLDAAEADDFDAVRAFRRSVDLRDLIARLGRAGWTAPHWPVEHGGRGLGDADARAVIAALDHWSVPRVPRGTGFVLAAPAIRQFASDDVKRLFLPRIATGEDEWAQLFSEPGAGSDLASLATSAVRDGDEWVVNGQKVWSTLAQDAQFGMLLARTDPTVVKHAGITYFGLDLRSPGVEIRPLVQMTGETEFNEIFLTDVRVPDRHRIGEVGAGWAASTASLSAERVTLSGGGGSGGGGGRKRQTRGILGGKTIDEVMELAAVLGVKSDAVRRDALMREYVTARVLALTVARSGPARLNGSLSKIVKAKSNQSLQVLALALLGAGGQAWEPGDSESAGYVREFLRTRANSIEGGTSEIQRNILGERVLGLPREPDPYKDKPWNEVPRS
jgi:alkylation response protein AidB-like acyl-CoA dehydrogenase